MNTSGDSVAWVMPRLQTEEGFRSTAYFDTKGNLTLGWGFNVYAGITRSAATALLAAQLSEIDAQLRGLPWYANLDAARQSVCLDIAFNAGLHGLLGYPHMIAALDKGDYETAANECTTDAPDLQARYAVLAQILRGGEA